MEKERLMKETRLEEKKAWQEKLKGKEYFYTLNKNLQKESQLDRFKVFRIKMIYPLFHKNCRDFCMILPLKKDFYFQIQF